MSHFVESLVTFYRNKQPEGLIALHEPSISEFDKTLVLDCLDSGWVSSVGAYVSRAEDLIASYTGASGAVATVNGTSALHLSLLSVGVSDGDEVITPSLTFVATTNAIRYCNADPHFIDVETDALGICPQKLRDHLADVLVRSDQCWINKYTGKKVKAIVYVHIFGLQGKVQEVAQIAKEFDLALVEDCAESLGTKIQGTHTGLFGDVAAFSFNGNKIITSGGGGMVITNDSDKLRFIKHLSTTAKTSNEGFFHHDQVGFNYRMPNLNAALLVGQLSSLDDKIRKKRALFNALTQFFRDFNEVTPMIPRYEYECNHWLLSVKVSPESKDSLIQELNDNGLMVRPLWNLNHTLPMYENCFKGDLSNSLSVIQQVISLPSSPSLIV